MANDKLHVTLDTTNTLYGIAFVVVSLALFTWLLPLFLPVSLVLAVVSVALAVAGWFLFMISRS